MRVHSVDRGIMLVWESFRKNRTHYLQEALGLAIFMISACFFGATLEGEHGFLRHFFPDGFTRMLIMGLMMGLTALFIFYSPFTAPSGSHINPAVTLVFLRLGKIGFPDALFYIIFQFIGGTLAVFVMAFILGNSLTDKPVYYVATVPGKYGIVWAAASEFITAFFMITMVLFTSENKKLKNYTRMIAGGLVCIYVIFGGPVSGFGMNPARTFSSALPSRIYTGFWIYMIVPVAGMLSAAEVFNIYRKRKADIHRLRLS
jgi:aquaporin Z